MFNKINITKTFKLSWLSKAGLISFICLLALLGNAYQDYSTTYQNSQAVNVDSDVIHKSTSITHTLESHSLVTSKRKGSVDNPTLIELNSFDNDVSAFQPLSTWRFYSSFIPTGLIAYSLIYPSRAPPISLF